MSLIERVATARPGPVAVVEAKAKPAEASRLFRVVWRWHFYAGIIVAPVLIVVAITGAAYTFREEVLGLAYAHLLAVTPGDKPAPYRDLVANAEAAAAGSHPGFRASGLQLSPEAGSSSVVSFREAKGAEGPRGRALRVFVDPYEGKVLGSLDSETDRVSKFFEVALAIHRRLFIGTTGRVIVELTTSWTILLLVTGLYLWWPRRKEKVRGVWVPRWGAKAYTVLRDLHSVGGAYLLPIALIAATTGLWYTFTLGLNFRKAAENWEAGRSVFSKDFPGQERQMREFAQRNRSIPAEAVKPASLPLEEIAAIGREQYPGKVLNISFPVRPDEAIKVGAVNLPGSMGPFFSAELQLDQRDLSIREQTTFTSSSKIRWWSSWNFPLHVGSVLGIASKILWFLACLVLVALPVTGFWMWLKRRPTGRTGFPRKPEMRLPWWLAGLIGLLCIALPMVGASVVLILLAEGAVGLIRRIRFRRRPPALSGA